MIDSVLNYGNMEKLTGKRFDVVRAFADNVPYLVELAREQGRQNAYSYRNFHVAGSIYAANLTLQHIWQDSAGNTKVRSDKDKVCAEKKLLRRADKMGMTHVIGMVVLGTTNRQEIQEVTYLATPTLHLCGDACQPEMNVNRMISRQTLLVTTGLDNDINQVLTVGQVLDGYDGTNKEARTLLFDSQPDFTDWEQRLATYDEMMRGMAELDPDIEMRQTMAQLALSGRLAA